MPRVKLGRDPAEDRREATRRVLRRAMEEQGMTTQKDVYQKIGMSQSSFSSKFRACKWNLDELVSLAKVLHLTSEDAGVILGIK